MVGPEDKVLGRKRERENRRTWVSTFTGVKGGGAKVLSVHSCQLQIGTCHPPLLRLLNQLLRQLLTFSAL